MFNTYFSTVSGTLLKVNPMKGRCLPVNSFLKFLITIFGFCFVFEVSIKLETSSGVLAEGTKGGTSEKIFLFINNSKY